MRIIAALIVGGVALFFGGVFSLTLSGVIGPCGSEATIGSTVVCVVASAVISLIGFVAIPSMRALGASLFSLPLGFAMIFLALQREWLRCLAILLCIIASAVTVWLAAMGQPRKREDQP